MGAGEPLPGVDINVGEGRRERCELLRPSGRLALAECHRGTRQGDDADPRVDFKEGPLPLRIKDTVDSTNLWEDCEGLFGDPLAADDPRNHTELLKGSGFQYAPDRCGKH